MELFTAQQREALSAPLDRNQVKTRQQAGQKLSYVEGWYCIDKANQIFGFDQWTRETVELRCVYEREVEKNKRDSGSTYTQFQVSYVARVRIAVADGVIREGTGAGHGQDNTSFGGAHESACKEAETDAMKRALMTFGYPFGLALYDKEQVHVADEAQIKRERLQPYLDDALARLAKAHYIADVVDVAFHYPEYERKLAEAPDLGTQLAQTFANTTVRCFANDLSEKTDGAGLKGAWDDFHPVYELLDDASQKAARQWLNKRMKDLGLSKDDLKHAA